MVNRNNARRKAKRRCANSSSGVENQPMLRKLVIILDDSWLEALKHLTCRQWSKMSLVCRQVNRIVQRNVSRLPRQVIGSITMDTNVTMRIVQQKLIDANFKSEERIHCQNFELLPYSNKPSTIQKIAQSLEWLVRNVRSDSIYIPEWMFNRIHENVEIRAVLTNFIFDASQKCKAQELVFSFVHVTFSNVKLVDILIEDFFALPVAKVTISRVVINCDLDYRQYRSKFGEYLIDLEVDSRADALYEIENGEKRVRISLFLGGWNYHGRADLKFYTI
ncbi:hypothetical protein Ddc_12972 [Ditylenchus destructor]|nr:hypothetical protein Ddc_12972 [Ditylenchus destructor]